MVRLTSSALLQCGLLASLSYASTTEPGPLRATNEEALAKWNDIRASVTGNNSGPLAARGFTPSLSPASLFAKREDHEVPGEGALLCTNGECVDGSCCSKDSICGYGPKFCGAGCQSHCDATAMCGEFSEGGAISCGLDLCCSSGGWCGTDQNHCVGPNKFAPCQAGFGKCEIIHPHTCGEGSGTSNKRKIGYYQSFNVQNRACNRIYPKDIKTDGYTHLYWAFATIDAGSFQLKTTDGTDEQQLKDFTALKGKGNNLQPWVAVGGFDFSDPGTSTHTTWSDLCADAGSRSAFIQSARSFMDKWGFQGIDLDWEYPGTEERGGSRRDIANFVTLLREMKASFGDSYGISLTLAPDYWYLRYFDVKGLEPYVDHFGFMAYDLHGFWDADVKALGSVVRGQADIREIRNNTLPLAYAQVDPSKIVLGTALYGRGYTLADPSCNTIGCGFRGPSKPGKCTNSAGVLSLTEIKEMIKNGEATSRLNKDAAMKELTFGDQWIGYDDDETLAMKKNFANDQCFGGIMTWSVDFDSGIGDGDTAPVSKDGRCGPSFGGALCEGSGYGDCCSGSSYCGSSEAHCSTDCVSGKCKQGQVSTSGRCGAGYNKATCLGSGFGDCCSAGGYCGSGEDWCGKGCQNGNCDDPVDPGPNKGVDTGDNMTPEEKEKICSYDFASRDEDVSLDTWVNTNASKWFLDFLYAEGADKWSDKFFQAVIAGGIQGGSTFDCDHFGSGNCAGPGGTKCVSYTPPEAFYVHIQIANLYSAYNQMYYGWVTESIDQLSNGIKDIVATWGTPPKEDNTIVLNMLVGILTSLTGLAGGIGGAISAAANPLTFMAGGFAQLAADSGNWQDDVDPELLNDELEKAWGEMFSGVTKNMFKYIANFFDGQLPKRLEGDTDAIDWVWGTFVNGVWLSKDHVGDLVQEYMQSTQDKWMEFATARALKTGNKHDYVLFVSSEDAYCLNQSDPHGGIIRPRHYDMSEKFCSALDGCIWHDNHCLCFGYDDPAGVTSLKVRLVGDDLKKLRTYVKDYDEALKNNYECGKYYIEHQSECLDAFGDKSDGCTLEDPTIPSYDDLEITQPLQYPKCFFNLYPHVDDFQGCVVNSDCDNGQELCDAGNDLQDD